MKLIRLSCDKCKTIYYNSKVTMPISHKYKAIFVHIPKTAGTSLNTMLEIEDSTDVATQKHVLFNGSSGYNAYQHFVPIDIKSMVSEQIWEHYYKFTFLRNPYNRALSSLNYLKNVYPALELETLEDYFIKCGEVQRSGDYDYKPFMHHFRFQHDYFEHINFDFVGLFERLNSDIEVLKAKLECNNNLENLNNQSYDKSYEWSKNEVFLFQKLFEKDIKLYSHYLEK